MKRIIYTCLVNLLTSFLRYLWIKHRHLKTSSLQPLVKRREPSVSHLRILTLCLFLEKNKTIPDMGTTPKFHSILYCKIRQYSFSYVHNLNGDENSQRKLKLRRTWFILLSLITFNEFYYGNRGGVPCFIVMTVPLLKVRLMSQSMCCSGVSVFITLRKPAVFVGLAEVTSPLRTCWPALHVFPLSSFFNY